MRISLSGRGEKPASNASAISWVENGTSRKEGARAALGGRKDPFRVKGYYLWETRRGLLARLLSHSTARDERGRGRHVEGK